MKKIRYLAIFCMMFFTYKLGYASSIHATIENNQIVVYKNQYTSAKNITNNSDNNKSFIKELIKKASLKYDVDEKFVLAVGTIESGLNKNAVSNKGAVGVMQIKPSTAFSLNINPNNLEQNIDGGVKYLKSLLNKYSGNYKLVAAAYNAGPKNVDKYNGIPPFHETKHYVKEVMTYFNGLTTTVDPNYSQNTKSSPDITEKDDTPNI